MLLRTWRSQCIQDVWCLGAGSCQQWFRNTGHWSRERPKISCPKRVGFRMLISSYFFFCLCFPPSGTSSSQWFKCNNVQQLQFHWSQDTTWTMSLSTSSTQGAAVKVGSDSIRSLDIFCNLNGGPVVPWQHCHGMGMNLCFFGYTLVRSSMMLQYAVPNLLQCNTIPFHDIKWFIKYRHWQSCRSLKRGELRSLRCHLEMTWQTTTYEIMQLSSGQQPSE